MTVTAFEVLLNGERLYVVGMEGWFSLDVSVSGHRFTRELVTQIRSQSTPNQSPKIPAPESEMLSLSSFVGLPDPDRPNASRGLSYGIQNLKVGDEVTIRVLESEDPDLPDPQSSGVGSFDLIAGKIE